jgi:hypothetical protein|tara:strand:- start:438 stop:671 length:234 start_codon:yes stop_codon:yes gene_type:complete
MTEDIQQEKAIDPDLSTTKSGLITGIISLVKKENPMASEAEVKFYIERRNKLREILETINDDNEYRKLLDSNKNGAD